MKLSFTTTTMVAFVFGTASMVFGSGCSKSLQKKDSETESSVSKDSSQAEFKPVDNDAVSPPVEVTGSFLTGLSCIVTNQNDTEASDTAVVCKIADKRGEKFAGKISDISANIVRAKSTTDVSGVVNVLGTDSTDSFVAVFVGVRPQDAIGVELKASLDGEAVHLQCALFAGAATVSLADMDLYVSASASPSNASCSKEAPCQSIRRALLFVPDFINHKVTIHVSEGQYAESIKISGKTVRDGALFELVGESSAWDGSHAIAHLSGAFAPALSNPAVTFVGNSGLTAGVRFRNFEIESCTNRGIYLGNSSATLGNVRVIDCTSFEPPSARVLFVGLTLSDSARVELNYGAFRISQLNLPPEVSSALGVVLTGRSELIISDDVILEPRLNSGILAREGSGIAVKSRLPVTIKIDNVGKAISVIESATFFDGGNGIPNQERRLTLSIREADVGIWSEHGEFSAEYADIDIKSCKIGCLYARSGGKITIGRDGFTSMASGINVASALGLNTVPPASLPSEGFIGFADQDSHISLLSTVKDIKICHLTDTKPVFEVGFGGSLVMRLEPTTLQGMTTSCTAPFLGKVKSNLGEITVSSAIQSQTLCSDDVSLLSCVNDELTP